MLRSAIANAQQKPGFSGDVERLYVSACYADQGPSQKRVRPAPMGRAYRVVKRTAHLTVAVAERPEKRQGRAARRAQGGQARPRRRRPRGRGSRPRRAARRPRGRSRSETWVRKSTRTGSGWGSTRPGARAGTRTATTRSCCTRTCRCATALKERFQHAGVSKIEIERAANKLKIDIHTSRPGIIIGRKGTEVDKLKQEIQKRTSREVFINIQEIQKPELDAQLISESVAMQLEKRVAFRRAMRKAVESALRFGARGIKVRVSGRLNGAEIARSEWYLHGQLPLQTLRADIDYGQAEAAHDLRPDRREGVALQGRAARAAHRPRRGIPHAAARPARVRRKARWHNPC